MQTLAEGNFGSVALANWRGTEVVVKTLKIKEWTKDLFISFVDEAATSQRLATHENIVPFVGACVGATMAMVGVPSSSCQLGVVWKQVYQFMRGGSLENELVKTRDTKR